MKKLMLTNYLQNSLDLRQYGLNVHPYSKISLPLATRGYVSIGYTQIFLNNVLDAYTCCGHGSEQRNVIAGRYCNIGNNVKLGLGQHAVSEISTSAAMYKNNVFPYVDRQNSLMQKNHHVFSYTILGNNVTIGDNSIFLNDITIGDGAVIMPNSTVTHDVPPFAIVSGHNRIIGYRFSDKIINDLIETKWWNYDLPQMLQSGLKIPYKNAENLIQFLKEADPQDLMPFPAEWLYFQNQYGRTVLSKVSTQELKKLIHCN